MSATTAVRERVRTVARVVENRPVAAATWWLELEAPEIAAAALPGQFLMIGFGLDLPELFMLPRPFSVGWRSEDGRLGLLVRIYGAGSRRIAALSPGDTTLLVGPLGRPFELDPGRPTICVAGGVGLAPFLFVGAEAKDGPFVRIVYGERTADAVFDPALIETLTGRPPEVWTEDGTVGRSGRVTDGLDLTGNPLLLACGPTPMLNAVQRMAAEAAVPLQLSVEEYMGCGVGTCVGCVVRSRDQRWIRSCIEGTVFNSEALAWPL